MAQSLTIQDLKTIIAYPFQDSEWIQKFLIAFLVTLPTLFFPIIPPVFTIGYFAQIMRDSIAGNELSLPEWVEWEKKLVDGIKLAVITLIAMLPIILIFLIAYGLLFITAIASDQPGYYSNYSIFSDLSALIGMTGYMVSFGVAFIVALVIGCLIPVIFGHVVATDEFAAIFRIGEWWAIFRANFTGYLASYIFILGLWVFSSFIIQFLYFTLCLCCLVPFVVILLSIYILSTAAVLFGSAYRDGKQALSENDQAA